MLGAERGTPELAFCPWLTVVGKKYREIKIDRGFAIGGRRLGEAFAARARVSAHRLPGGGHARPFAAREVFTGNDFFFDSPEGVAGFEAERGNDLTPRAIEAARLEQSAQVSARAHRLVENFGEALVACRCHGGGEGSSQVACGFVRSVEQNGAANAVQQFVSAGLFQHFEARRNVRLERELMQHAITKGVDRLHLEAARCLDRRREEPPRGSAARVRLRRRVSAFAAARRAASRSSSVPSSRRTHSRSVFKTWFAMWAAAALVKVRQRMRAGGTPARSNRIARWASTWVLPEPALAATQAEAAGSEAAAWASRVFSGIARAFIRLLRCSPTIPQSVRGGRISRSGAAIWAGGWGDKAAPHWQRQRVNP